MQRAPCSVHQGGGNVLERNLIFNMVRETADHGAFNRHAESHPSRYSTRVCLDYRYSTATAPTVHIVRENERFAVSGTMGPCCKSRLQLGSPAIQHKTCNRQHPTCNILLYDAVAAGIASHSSSLVTEPTRMCQA